MTPGELRRIAERKLIEATALVADADRLRTPAVALQGLLEPIVPMSQRVWIGPAAEDFEAKARYHSWQLDRQSSRLIQIAAEFEDEATRLRRNAEVFQVRAVAAEAAARASGCQAGL
jgi:hypothetical protein